VRIVFDKRQHLFVNQICFRYHNQAIADAEQATDIKMLARLWHHTFISRDHERKQIDPVRSGEHVLYETFVTRNVDKSDAQIIQLEIGKAEIDGDAATFFFRKAIGIGAGQSAHKGALAVIDMTGGADNQRMRNHRLNGFQTDFFAMTCS
jgi:hypothetical protein